MSKLLNKPTPTVNDLAKKYGVSVLEVKKQLMKGMKVEKEHTNDPKIAREIALDHLGEKLNYYTLLAKIEEEIGVEGIRGLGYVSGDPAGTNFVQQYIDTNAMSYEDENGNKLEFIKKDHLDLHNKGLGYSFFDPTKIKTLSNFIKEERLNELGGMTGYEGISDSRSARKDVQVDEGEKLKKAKKVAMAGMTAANIYTLGDVMSRASSGHGSPKGDIVRAASTLPGAPGWAATGVHYAKKAYDHVKGKKMNEDKDPCWKGYEMVGMKKKGAKKVPNCVPVKEQGPVMSRYTERPTYEGNDKYPDTAERGIYETIKSSLSHKVVHRDSKKIIAQGTKKEMMKKVKALNAKNPGSHFVGNAPSKKVGDTFSEGHIGFGHPYDWAGDRVKRKVFGTKPKDKPASNEPGTDDTYKGSKQGGKVKLVKTVKEAIAATAVPPSYQPTNSQIERRASQQARGSIAQGQTKIPVRDISPTSRTSGTGTARLAPSSSSGGFNTMKPTTTDVTRNISNRFNPSFSQQQTGAMKASSVRGGTSFSQGGGQVAQKMSTASPSQMVAKMSDAGRQAAATVSKAAPLASRVAGAAIRAAGGPAMTAAAAVMSPTPAGEKTSEFQRQSDVAKGISYKAQGRSISDYEKQVLTPSREKVNTTPGQGSTKNTETPTGGSIPTPDRTNAPLPPERPDYFSRGQAFQSARGEAGGGEGKFSYDNKSYQTNVAGEPYKAASKLKQTSVQEDWQSVNRKDKTDGLSQKAVNAYKRENPGSKLQTAVTEKNPTGKRASRRKSFCSRMGGMKKRLTSAKTARDPDSRINKALRRWNCEEEVQINELKAETLGSYVKKAAASRKKSLEGSKPDIKTWSKREHGIRTAFKKLTCEEGSQDKDWDETRTPFREQIQPHADNHTHLNKPDTRYAPGATGTTHTVYEETTMDNTLINEAIENIMEDNLGAMKDNLMVALQEKALEKLEERKKEIAANYFAQ